MPTASRICTATVAANARGHTDPATLTDPRDFNRDRRVNALDFGLARNAANDMSTALVRLTVPVRAFTATSTDANVLASARLPGSTVPVNDRYDLNRDGRVDALDTAVARAFATTTAGALPIHVLVFQPFTSRDAPPWVNALQDEDRVGLPLTRLFPVLL